VIVYTLSLSAIIALEDEDESISAYGIRTNELIYSRETTPAAGSQLSIYEAELTEANATVIPLCRKLEGYEEQQRRSGRSRSRSHQTAVRFSASGDQSQQRSIGTL
jgi:hypothetical protein